MIRTPTRFYYLADLKSSTPRPPKHKNSGGVSHFKKGTVGRPCFCLGNDSYFVPIRHKNDGNFPSFFLYVKQPERLPKKKAFSGRGETRRKAKPFFKTASKETLFRRGDAIASATNNRCSVAPLLTNPISSTTEKTSEPLVFFYVIR